LKIIPTKAGDYDSPVAREITADEVQPESVQLVDVRTPEEREAGRIPGDTAHIPFDELQARAAEVDRDTPVVFYCRAGDRSASAADAFAASGYDAASLAGGIVGWDEAGKPVDGEIAQPSGLPPR
jgi:rhodanese-related sulfurtransferase